MSEPIPPAIVAETVHGIVQPPPVAEAPAPRDSNWRTLAAIGLAVAAVGAGVFWFVGRDDATDPVTGPVTTAIDVPTSIAAPTSIDVSVSINLPTSFPLPDSTAAPTSSPGLGSTVAQTTVPPETLPPAVETLPPDPSTVPASAPIGAEWLEDGSYPAPDFQWVGGDYVPELGYSVDLLVGPDGYQIWLAKILDDSGEFLLLRLDDAVSVELTELMDVVLGSTSCAVDGVPISGVVGTFLFDEQPELTQPLEVWVIDPEFGELTPTAGAAVCENEGYGV